MSKPYTSEQETLRAAITNFIGIAASSSMYEGKDAVRNVVALFLEELIQYIESDEGINMNASKPIFRAVVYVLEQRQKDINDNYRKSFNTEPPESLTNEITQLIQSLNDYIDKIKQWKERFNGSKA